MTRGRRPLTIVDCDPGQDDVVAIITALAYTRLLGVSVCYGNTPLADGYRNARDILALAGRPDIPVSAGEERPLHGHAPPPSPIHGPNGLGGIELPASSAPKEKTPAPELLRELILNAGEPVTLVAIGPLTNVAVVLQRYPEIKENVERIAIMGGSTTFGNVTPVAEFNVHADPEAARVVFRSGVPITMCGLNVTRYASLSESALDKLEASGYDLARLIAKILRVRLERIRATYDLESISIHDPCAVLALTHPKILSFRSMHVDVELTGELTRGMTVCDQRPGGKIKGQGFFQPRLEPNAEVAVEINSGFEQAVVNAILEVARHDSGES